MITYDSEKDLIYAFGEGGRGVIYAEQFAAGQPSTQGLAKAVQLQPQDRCRPLCRERVRPVDRQELGRQAAAATHVDPDFKKKKPPKKGFRIHEQQRRTPRLHRAIAANPILARAAPSSVSSSGPYPTSPYDLAARVDQIPVGKLLTWY